MHSMTGFGTGRSTAAAGMATVQVSTVNHKSLSVHLRSDLRDLALEESMRTAIRGRLVRGSVTVSVTWESARAAAVDQERLAAVWQELAALARRLGAPPPDLHLAWSCLGHQRSDDTNDAAAPVMAALTEALDQLQAVRAREGQALQADLHAKAAQLRTYRVAMHELAARRLPRVRAALVQRLNEALGAAPPLSEEVLARELAIHADRLDVSEELTRLEAHGEALDRLLSADEPVGRQLDFLLQEIGREINTTGAKSNDAELTAQVLMAKNLLEQVREQVANIE